MFCLGVHVSVFNKMYSAVKIMNTVKNKKYKKRMDASMTDCHKKKGHTSKMSRHALEFFQVLVFIYTILVCGPLSKLKKDKLHDLYTIDNINKIRKKMKSYQRLQQFQGQRPYLHTHGICLRHAPEQVFLYSVTECVQSSHLSHEG